MARKTGITETYSWTQTYEEFVLRTPLPRGCTSRDVRADFRNKYLKLSIKGTVVAEGKLCGSISPEDATWSIDDGYVEVSIEKSYSDWWPGLLEGETYVEAKKSDAKANKKEGGGEDQPKKKQQQASEAKEATTSAPKPEPKTAAPPPAKEEKIPKQGPTPTAGSDKKSAANANKNSAPASAEEKSGEKKSKMQILGKKGHGEVNELGNEGEDITSILGMEQKCQTIFDTLVPQLGIEHEATLHAAFNLMDQWIGNYRMSRIDDLLNGNKHKLMAICRNKGGQWVMRAVQMLAFCRWKQFRFREALTLFYEFQSLAGKSAILLENMGHTHNSLGETDKAEECFTEALDRISRGDRGNKGGLLMGLGIVKKSRGDLKGSVRVLLEALEFYKGEYKGVDHSIVAKSHTAVGRSLEALGETRKAEHHFYEAVRIFWITCGFSPLTANASKKLGELQLALGKANGAQQLLKQALELHVSFDTLDIRAIMEIIQVIPALHLKPRWAGMLAMPDFNQYVPSLKTLRDRVDRDKLKMNGDLAVLFKAAGEVALPGGAFELSIEFLNRAMGFFKATTEVDCSQLVSQCEQLVAHAQQKLGVRGRGT
mmetsp:Transcript_3367/g.6467  ORF Transcript_3367/g.6467 Transcript_3367/m.6467 type:complete len:598 (+) Transcript_3367:86-1879(+)